MSSLPYIAYHVSILFGFLLHKVMTVLSLVCCFCDCTAPTASLLPFKYSTCHTQPYIVPNWKPCQYHHSKFRRPPLPPHSTQFPLYLCPGAMAHCSSHLFELSYLHCTSNIMARWYVQSAVSTCGNSPLDSENIEPVWLSGAEPIQLLLVSLNPMKALCLVWSNNPKT